MPVKIRGLSGLNTLAIGEASASYTGQADPYPVQHTRLLKSSTSIWEGFTFSLSGRGSRTYDPLERPVFQMQFRVDDVSPDGNTVYVSEDGSSLRHLLVLGGRAIVSRKVSGQDVIVRASDVADANWDQWDPDDMSSGSSVEAPLHGYYKHGGHRYYYALASVEDVGGELRHGPLVEIGSVTLPDSAGNSTATSSDLSSERDDVVPGGSLAAPTGVTLTQIGDGSTVQASFTPNPSAYGTLLFRSGVDPATIPAKSFITLASDAEAVQVGDHITIHNPITQIDPDIKAARTYFDNGSHPFDTGASNFEDAFNYGSVVSSFHHFAEEAVSPPAGFDGNVYTQCVIPDGLGKTQILRRFYRAATFRTPFYDYYEPGDVLRWKSWVYVDAAAQMTLDPDMAGTSAAVIDLTAGWTWVEETFTCNEAPAETAGDDRVRSWRVQMEAEGAGDLTVRFCGLRPHRDGEPDRGFSQITRDSIPAGAWVRGHDLAKEGYFAISLESWTGPSYEGRSVNALYELCQEAGAKPWIHVPTTRDDVFVAGVGGHFISDWLSEFGTIRVEPGYEAWNSLDDGIVFSKVPDNLEHHPSGDLLTGGQSFGMIADRIMDALEGLSGWPDAVTVLGGWASQSFGLEAAAFFVRDHVLTIAAYATGWDSTTNVVSDDTNGYEVSVSVGEASRLPSDFSLLNDQAVAIRADQPASDVEVATYEGGYGVQINGLKGATVTEAQKVRQEVVKHSIAAATGVLDTSMLAAEAGHKDTNLFTASEGTGFCLISPRVEGNKLTPMYQLAKIIQEAMDGPCSVLGSGIVRDTTQTVTGPDDEPASFATTNVTALRPVANPSRLIVVVRNRSDTDTVLPVLMTPFASASSAKVYPMSGDLRLHNANPVGLRRSGEPKVDGVGQSGTTLRLTSVGGNEHVGNTFTFDGGSDATVYTVTAQSQVDPDTFDLTITPTLAAIPDNGRKTIWGDGLGWVPDETCVDINIAGDRIDLTGPLDLSSITVDDTYGATESGMLPGNSIVIVFDGVS